MFPAQRFTYAGSRGRYLGQVSHVAIFGPTEHTITFIQGCATSKKIVCKDVTVVLGIPIVSWLAHRLSSNRVAFGMTSIYVLYVDLLGVGIDH